MRTIKFFRNRVILIDQTLLPNRVKNVVCRSVDDIARAIERMQIRGAPALAAAGAMGVALSAVRSRAKSSVVLKRELDLAAKRLRRTRPTAVNLFVGINRVLKAAEGDDVSEIKRNVVREAKRVVEEDVRINMRIGEHGKRIVPKGATILTHCNAGALATVAYGTALGVIRAAHNARKKIRVIATETRPLLQGARLTSWELGHEGIPVRVIVDGAVGHMMSRGEIDLVIVGADRIAANGDTANKIGTYTIAVLAKRHGIPFYVAAPLSTVDFSLRSGMEIPIEFRDPNEVAEFRGVRILPGGVRAVNPAFDVTPAELITGIITECGVVKPGELRKFKNQAPNL